MALSIGIIGLPNVGKSTLLNALACSGAESSNYPFCTIDCNKGAVLVPDKRLERLRELLQPEEVIPSTVNFIDIAGLVEGASRGEGLGNKFLHHVREVDVLAHVLRCFADQEVSHIHGNIDPFRDLEIVETELFLADLERVERWMEREENRAKAKKKEERKDLELLESIRDKLSRGERLLSGGLPEYQELLLCELRLLTSKPRLLVLNTGDEDARGASELCRSVREKYGEENTFVVSVKIEEELNEIDAGDRKDFMRELDVEAGAKERFIEKCHELLGLIRYYTTAHGKLQAWSIKSGTTAPQAAGRIHSDMEKRFIRAEVMRYEDVIKLGSKAEIQHHGLLRTEGHDYVVGDGDIIQFLFQN